MRTSIFLSPHPDDEFIRFGSYIPFAADRGDRMVLIQATNGARTFVKDELGLTGEATIRWRYREQRAAWDWLTDGRGEEPIYGYIGDGRSTTERVLPIVESVVAQATGHVELYVASWHYDREGAVEGDLHVDHRSCVDVGRVMANRGLVVRYGKHYSSPAPGGTGYRPTPEHLLRMEGAAASYAVIGQRSVPESISRAATHVSRATG